MAKKRNRLKQVKATKDFLVATVVCTFLCLWAVRDAWFPTQGVLEKHPLRLEVGFNVSGVIKHMPAIVGQEVGGEMVLAEIYDDTYVKSEAAADAAFKLAKKNKSADVQVVLDELLAAREELKGCTLKCSDTILTTSHGEEGLRGIVLEHLVKPGDEVEIGQGVIAIEPHDTFYLFNQTLAILSLIGAIAFLTVHVIVTK